MNLATWNTWLNQIRMKNQKETKFVVVRNPFERLVSAFRERMEVKCLTEDMKNFGKAIVKQFRKEYLQHFPKDSLSKENNYGSLYPLQIDKDGCGARSANMPTFWEFAQWLIVDRNHLRNEHWIPVGNFCGICQNNYDYIIKIDNFGT